MNRTGFIEGLFLKRPDVLEFSEAMDPMLMKARHFASYQVLHSRGEGGTARRNPRR